MLDHHHPPQLSGASTAGDKSAGDLRERIAKWTGLLAVLLLGVSSLLLGYMWLYAWQHYLYPRVPWESPLSGPWTDNGTLGNAWGRALGLSGCSSFTATISLLSKANWRTAIVLGASLVWTIIVFWHLSLLTR